MPRYIRKFARLGHSLGPSEERGFQLWVGYDVDGLVEGAEDLGLIRVDDWTEERLGEVGVAAFKKVTVEELERWKS